ncbi:MAG: hypothetical protein KKA31_01285, partial [Candidatus Margulisbacteria bacterium]|nr:hypothetical protein [Candidatus Margulisiibacteriota bacterium]
MAVTPASFHGWPAQLRFARAKPLTNAHLRANALAHNLYLTLTNAAASASFEQIAGQKVGQMLSAYDLPVVIEAAILAARLFSAGRLNKAIEILSNKHLFEVAAEIEELATQLADQLLVGDELPTDLAITGAITNDTMMVILKEIPETLKYFKYSELADFDLINGLRNDPQKRERFIAERKNYQPASSMAELEAQLKAKFNQAKKLLGEASDLDLLFWNPYFLIIKQLPDEGSKAIVYEGFSALLDISKCLDHDICST